MKGAQYLFFASLTWLPGCGVDYKSAVLRELSTDTKAQFLNVKEYEGGAVCGVVQLDSHRRRFIVRVNGNAAIEDRTPLSAQTFDVLEASICRDTN